MKKICQLLLLINKQGYFLLKIFNFCYVYSIK